VDGGWPWDGMEWNGWAGWGRVQLLSNSKKQQINNGKTNSQKHKK